MKKKQLIILLVFGLILAAVYIWQQSARTSDWEGGTESVSEHLLPADFDMEAVATVRIEKDSQVLTMVKNEQGWGMQERFGYPLDFANLKTLFVDLYETKVAQQLTLDQAQAGELSLVPGKGAVLMTLLDKEGRELSKLVFGQKHERESDMPPTPYGGGGNIPLGRFMELGDGQYILAANTFSRVDDGITDWLDREFFKISDMKQAILKDGETVLWEAGRDDKSAELKLAGGVPEGKEIDSSKLSSVKNAFSWIRFSDIADPASTPESTGFDKAKVLQVTDFDGFVYSIILAAPVEGKQHLKVSVSWQGALERKPVADEKPEDKEKADAEFAAKVRENQDKARELNARLSPWIYLVEARNVESVTIARTDFFKDKPKPEPAKEEKKEQASTEAAATK
ncbi:MAG: DUF4340 domain-containing protein [Lentisphaeria bacterium]|jgi:hypothetical protein|nr:DUF4340 domain-containing protein [Lentisphaeria bacterium]